MRDKRSKMTMALNSLKILHDVWYYVKMIERSILLIDASLDKVSYLFHAVLFSIIR